jgi:hypothetical protein
MPLRFILILSVDKTRNSYWRDPGFESQSGFYYVSTGKFLDRIYFQRPSGLRQVLWSAGVLTGYIQDTIDMRWVLSSYRMPSVFAAVFLSWIAKSPKCPICSCCVFQTSAHHQGNAASIERSFPGWSWRWMSEGRLPRWPQSGDVPHRTSYGQ